MLKTFFENDLKAQFCALGSDSQRAFKKLLDDGLNVRGWLFLEPTECDEHLLAILQFGTGFTKIESRVHRAVRQ